jgi:hypothetical protein
MVPPSAGDPRWPVVRAGRGHYESYFLRACDPAGGRGIWLRYTVLITGSPGSGRGGAPPRGELWCTWFDRQAGPPRHARVEAGVPRSPGEPWISMRDSTFGRSAAVGALSAPGLSARWSLRYRAADRPLLHLPARWMYRARTPKTKLAAPCPVATFDGEFDVDGRRIVVDGWPGMVGHNWGERHAESWVWVHGLGLGDDGWLDLAIARLRLGGITTPWIANGVLSLGGRRRRLGGPGRPVALSAAGDRCVLRVRGRRTVLTAAVSAPPEAFVAWSYPSPDGVPAGVRNCSVADLAVTVRGPGRGTREFAVAGTAAYEIGRRGELHRP